MERFAAIDFETANGKRSSICSIGIVGKLRDIPLVAHNSPFDEGCLRAAHEAYGRCLCLRTYRGNHDAGERCRKIVRTLKDICNYCNIK